MNRLTERVDGYIRIVGCKTLYSSSERPGAYLNNALIRLAAYEDAMPLERAQELAQAEKDGRLVVPPPPAEEGDPKPECFYNEANNPLAWCFSMAKSKDDDEPTERCKACWYCEAARQEAEEALGEVSQE